MTTQTKRIYAILGVTFAALIGVLIVLGLVPYFTSWSRFRQLLGFLIVAVPLLGLLATAIWRKDIGASGETGDGSGE